mgnify:CR=1 FL=1
MSLAATSGLRAAALAGTGSCVGSGAITVTDARFDALYAERVKVLSDSESRMGLDPRWHIAGHAVMLENLIGCLVEQLMSKSLLTAGRKRHALVVIG